MPTGKDDRINAPRKAPGNYVSRKDSSTRPEPVGKQPKPEAWPKEVLVVGIGNCGRADDGLGWAFLEQLEAENAEAYIAYRYQLQIEDAELISHHPVVVFVDASEEILPAGFECRKCLPASRFDYSTHALAPEAVAGLCSRLYDARPQTYVLAIQGYEWGLREGLSRGAHQNLLEALAFFYEKTGR